MHIEIEEQVKNDIKAISSYIALDSEYYAHQTANEIRDKIYKLKTSIYYGRKVPELNSENIREILYKDHYRIIFKIEYGTIYVIQVLHTSQDFNKNFRFEKL